jgi:hypothetical protein
VAVRGGSEQRRAAADARTDAADARRLASLRDDEAKLLATLDALDPKREGVGLRKARERAGLSGDRASAALTRLEAQKILERLDVTADIGAGATRKVQGLRRPPADHRDHWD